MDITITAAPIAWVPLTDQQVDVLITCSQLHYDLLCRRASEPGGFIFGWKNGTRWAAEQKDLVSAQQVTLRNIDLSLKILEVQPPTLDLEVLQRRHDLHALLLRLADELRQAGAGWTHTVALNPAKGYRPVEKELDLHARGIYVVLDPSGTPILETCAETGYSARATFLRQANKRWSVSEAEGYRVAELKVSSQT